MSTEFDLLAKNSNEGTAMTDLRETKNMHADAVRAERERCLAAVDAEPELPGDIPPELERALATAMKNGDTGFVIHALRLAVRLTKAEIRDRIVSG